MEVNIYQAKTHLSRLLQRVAEGEEVTIARSGVPVARLVAVESESHKRPLDFARGQVLVADDFDAPLPDDILASFYGGQIPKPAKSQRKRRK
jgi:prevent-host-death family protein